MIVHNISVTFSTFQLRKYVHGSPLVQGKSQKLKLFLRNLVATCECCGNVVTSLQYVQEQMLYVGLSVDQNRTILIRVNKIEIHSQTV
jgi:hypothetical protein